MSDTDDNKTKKEPQSFPATPGSQYPHACLGLNACKNLGRTQDNNCAGAGYCSTTLDHTCHVQNQCKGQGGCGLYGTAEEFSRPGQNDCKFQGSCATPINAERFATTSPTKAEQTRKDDPLPDVRGKSVWHQARLSFEKRWNDGNLERPANAPTDLNPPPEELPNGPTYEWISTLSKNCMTACGASGMSGAGSCS